MMDIQNHVDDFIDYNFHEHTYARWVLNYFRMGAALKSDFAPYMKAHQLFCTHEGERYRVTGASRLGDVWLAKDFDRTTGYDLRVMLYTITEWSDTPLYENRTNEVE